MTKIYVRKKVLPRLIQSVRLKSCDSDKNDAVSPLSQVAQHEVGRAVRAGVRGRHVGRAHVGARGRAVDAPAAARRRAARARAARLAPGRLQGAAAPRVRRAAGPHLQVTGRPHRA